MKMSLPCVLLLIQLIEACAELIFRQQTDGQSLELSCSPQLQRGAPTGLHLYHRGARSQTTLLSMAEGGGGPRLNAEHVGRLRLAGGLDSRQVNVTVALLQPSDTGLYVWELSYGRGNRSEQMVLGAPTVFLLVEGAGGSCRCSASYPLLLLIIFTVAGLLLLTLGLLALEKCVKSRHHHRPQPPVPIYEEMTCKQRSPVAPKNNPEAPSHLEEVNFPAYANTDIRQPQDNYYACPRQLALRA
ncbi:uncharacterized protein LOC120827516 [Gasterosteus aculeatus]|uniref:uncharacterized protein LOC120827516 n=1 Tax=Gasterosteus aculeatus aculeatus TaxID=481459 RepID=UPI001A97F01C|nr:uncharacterized protein LOC120827516 [Gasterosteus aculeatus aculeatus]